MIIAAVELDHSSDCVCEHVECILTGIVTCMVKSVLSLSSGGLPLFTRSGNQDNGPAIRNINELHLEVGKKKRLKNTQTYVLLSWHGAMVYFQPLQNKWTDLFSIRKMSLVKSLWS